MIPVFHGNVDVNTEGCKIPYLKIDSPTALWKYMQTLQGKSVDITIKQHKSQRSNNQNNYYFGVVCKILGDYFGYTEEEMHDALKMKFLRHGPCDMETVKSTTKLNTAEFEDYLEKIRRWAVTEYSVSIPLPNECEL